MYGHEQALIRWCEITLPIFVEWEDCVIPQMQSIGNGRKFTHNPNARMPYRKTIAMANARLREIHVQQGRGIKQLSLL